MKIISSTLILAALTTSMCAQNSKSTEKSMDKAPDRVTTAVGDIVLPKPGETKSAMNFSKVLGWTGNQMPVAPEGFTVEKYSGSLKNPRWIYVLPNGDVLVAEVKKEEKGLTKVGAKLVGKTNSESKSTVNNRITIFRDTDKDGKPDLQEVFLEGANMPFGMVVLKDHLYVACTDAVMQYPYKTGQTRITSAGKKIADLPADGRHWTKNIIASPDGSKLYVAVGSASNVAEDGMEKEVKRACILEMNPDGSGLRVYAAGLRNPVGMDYYPGSTTLWTAVNERDELGDDLVPDYMTSVRPNGFYGWPDSYFGQHLDARIKEPRMDLVREAIVPDVPLGPHTASLGLAFYDEKVFPTKYLNGAFVGQHGSWNRSVPTGYQVVFVPFRNGKPTGQPEPFLTGFMANADKNEVYGRPVGVAVLPDGSMLVADDAGDTVWRIKYGK
ncbi:MAG: sorbosone dehydrogenase family protein [Bacteroidota bacterium]